jgi:hypothetical protein
VSAVSGFTNKIFETSTDDEAVEKATEIISFHLYGESDERVTIEGDTCNYDELT